MMTYKDCKFCCGKPKPCLLELAGINSIRGSFCENYLERDLYKWIHSRSVEFLQNGFQLVSDDHDGQTHSFMFRRGVYSPVIRELVYTTAKTSISAKILDEHGRQLLCWNSFD